MKYIKTYNESIRHLLKPKSEENILKDLKKLSDSDRIKKIIINKLPYSLLPDNLTINGNLDCSEYEIDELPDNLVINGHFYCNDNLLKRLPNNLTVNGFLKCDSNLLTELPEDLKVKYNLYCVNNLLPKDIKKPKGVKGEMYL